MGKITQTNLETAEKDIEKKFNEVTTLRHELRECLDRLRKIKFQPREVQVEPPKKPVIKNDRVIEAGHAGKFETKYDVLPINANIANQRLTETQHQEAYDSIIEVGKNLGINWSKETDVN